MLRHMLPRKFIKVIIVVFVVGLLFLFLTLGFLLTLLYGFATFLWAMVTQLFTFLHTGLLPFVEPLREYAPASFLTLL